MGMLLDQTHRELQPRLVGELLAGAGQRVEVVADLLDVRVGRRRVAPVVFLSVSRLTSLAD